jgi:4-hydroxybenzoate polyprenyltransferase
VDDPAPAAPPAPPAPSQADARGGDAEQTTRPLDTEPTVETEREPEPDEGDPEKEEPPFRLGNLTPFLLIRAAHPRQALVTAVGMAVAAALAGRPSRELLLILGTVLVGQVILGWFNDLVDRERDARHQRAGKPLADGRLDPGTVWFCLALAIFLVVPLSIANGKYAGTAYLVSLAIGLAGQWVWLRKGFFSWLPWAASFALYPAFLSYGGWGGEVQGAPPELLMTGLAALLGIGVHLLTALWGLVADNEDHWTYLPLKLGLKIGASRLLWVAGTYTALVLVGLAFAGTYVGLAQEPL